MNELELLERFRADGPEPDEFWLRELRGRVTTQEREGGPRAASKRRRVVLVAAAAMLASLVLLGSIVLPADGPAGPDPAVADVLRRFSRIAGKAPAEQPPQPGQYLYWKATDVTTYLFFPGPELEPFAYRISGVEERWLGLDGSGRDVYEVGQPEFLTEADRRAYEAFLGTEAAESWGEFDWGKTYDDRDGPGELGGDGLPDLSKLPSDPDELRAELERQEAIGGSNGDWGVFTWAADLLSVGYMSPELRSAFYKVMSTIPGTELIGPVEDELGRRGIAIGHTRDGIRDEIVFNRRTGKVLSTRTVRVEDDPNAGDEIGQNPCCGEFAWAGTEAGTVMHSAVYLFDGEVVDSVRDRPDVR